MADALGHRGEPEVARPLHIYRARLTVDNVVPTELNETNIPGWSRRTFLRVTNLDAGSGIWYATAAGTNGTDAIPLAAALGVNQMGGYIEETRIDGNPYTGPCSLLAITAPAVCLVEVV